MGGMITIVARYEDGQIDSFKTSTNFFNDRFNTPSILQESWLKRKIIKHNMLRDDHLPEEDSENYDGRKGVKAPYEYGIILIDYLYKKILSANNYNSMIRGSSASLLDQYELLVNQDFEMQFSSKGNIEIINLKETRFQELCEIHFIHKALESGAIILKNEEVVYHTGTIESVISNIYGLKLEGLSPKNQIEIIKESKKKEDTEGNYTFDVAKYGDITFQYPNFAFIEGNGNQDSKIVLDYMLANNFELTPFEQARWLQFIEYNKED